LCGHLMRLNYNMYKVQRFWVNLNCVVFISGTLDHIEATYLQTAYSGSS
jgi:hypothetical protein